MGDLVKGVIDEGIMVSKLYKSLMRPSVMKEFSSGVMSAASQYNLTDDVWLESFKETVNKAVESSRLSNTALPFLDSLEVIKLHGIRGIAIDDYNKDIIIKNTIAYNEAVTSMVKTYLIEKAPIAHIADIRVMRDLVKAVKEHDDLKHKLDNSGVATALLELDILHCRLDSSMYEYTECCGAISAMTVMLGDSKHKYYPEQRIRDRVSILSASKGTNYGTDISEREIENIRNVKSTGAKVAELVEHVMEYDLNKSVELSANLDLDKLITISEHLINIGSEDVGVQIMEEYLTFKTNLTVLTYAIREKGEKLVDEINDFIDSDDTGRIELDIVEM